MRDDAARWPADTGLDQEPIRTPGLSILVLQPDRLTLLSGPVAASLVLAGQGEAVGWPSPAMGGTYALRLRRDRILVVNGPEIATGWHGDEGVAVSEVTGGYAGVELTGAQAFAVLQRGTEITRAVASPGVARVFHGCPALIYGHSGEDRFRLRVSRAQFAGMWSLLRGFAGQTGGLS
jgi:hypothetical protein